MPDLRAGRSPRSIKLVETTDDIDTTLFCIQDKAGNTLFSVDRAGVLSPFINPAFTNVLDPQFSGGADKTGAANSASAINAAMAASGSGFTLLPNGIYLVSALTSLVHSKIWGIGAVLKPSANSMSVLTLAASSDLGEGDQVLVRDLRIDGTGKTGIIGIDNQGGSGGSIAGVLEDVIAYQCADTGIHLRNSQFTRTVNCRAAHCGVGMKIVNAASSGGANSHQHFGIHLTYNTVGLFCDGTAFIPLLQLNFYDPQYLGNTVCGMAFFSVGDAKVIGGTPEANGTGASTATIDGKTVKKSDVYLNNSQAKFFGHHAGTQLDPSFLAENNSVLSITDLTGGYDPARIVQCDSTSVVHLHGLFRANGIFQNVATWPDSFAIADASVRMYGSPVLREDPNLSVLYAERAPNFVDAGGGGTTPSFVEDADLGYCRQIVYSASAGTYFVNSELVSVGAGAASQDTLITMLVKSSVDCVIGMELFDGASPYAINFESVGGITLKAGKVTRIVMAKKNIPASGTWQLQMYPLDTTGPTLKVSNLQVYQGPSGSPATFSDLAKIVKHGAFSPGKTRETATNLALKAQAVNTKGKYPGKQVWDTTNNRVVFSAGRLDTDVWKDGVNTTVYTPV